MILHTPYTIRSRRHNVLCGHVLCTLVAFLVASQLERTTVRAADDPLPKAEEILDQYVEVSGGKAAYEKLHNRATKGTLDFVTTGIKATVTTYSAEPDKMRTIIESPAIGKVEEGTDGEIAWELSLMTGPRIKEGDEKATTMRAAAFDSTVNWRKQYDKAECAGVETVEDKPCHKVILTPATGMPETHYYEQESGLLVKMNQTIKSPMGVIPVETLLSDYKKVDGILIPHTIRQFLAGQELVVRSQSIQHNVETPADRFELPAEVKALVDKSKATGD